MTQKIDREKLFWEAMQTLQLLIEDGVIDIEKAMPSFYQALANETEQRLKGQLQEINEEYANIGSKYINGKIRSMIASDERVYNELAAKYQDLEQAIKRSEKRLIWLQNQEQVLLNRKEILNPILFFGFVLISVSSFMVLIGFTNLFLGASLTSIWSEVYLGRFNWNQPSLGAVLSILIKIILSVLLFIFGALLVFTPWLAFNWFLTKLPYQYRKPFDISKHR